MEKSTTVSAYILKHEVYSNILNKLRNILLNTPLNETVKWGIPTYTFDNKNMVGIERLKIMWVCGFFREH